MPFQQAKSRDDFRVAVICALPLEADMVTRVFDVKHKDLGKSFGKAKGDRNVYTTGVIAGHNVVLIQMPDIGKVKAAAAATEARISFRHIQIAFIVGICGVLPTHPETKEDIVLGDCIISRTMVQYDHERRHSSNSTTKPALSELNNPYIPSLLAILQTAEDRQAMTEELMTCLQEMHGKSSLEDLYPGPRRDRLYQSDYRHAHPPGFGKCPQCIPGTDDCALDCEIMGCFSDRLIKRDRLATFTSTLGSPKIHFDNMGSGDFVISSSLERNRIAHEYNLIAFEMEGAGIWNSFPTVVIKSASDYANSHKNKGWQYYAAAVAAAGLKSFLHKWTITEKSMSQAESSRWSVVCSGTDDGSLVRSNGPITTFMDATIMLDPRYQEAFPVLFQRMVGTGWQDTILSEDPELSQALATDKLNLSHKYHTANSNPKLNETSPISPTSTSSTHFTMPPIDLLRLSINVGLDFSLSIVATNIESIQPKFKDTFENDTILTQEVNMPSNSAWKSYPPSLITPRSHRYPSNGALRELYLSSKLDSEVDQILLDDAALVREVTQHLVEQAKISVLQPNPDEQEVLYPANIISMTVSEMLDAGLMKASKRLIASVLTAIQEKVFTHSDSLELCAFWLTNVHGILSFFYKEKDLYHEQMVSDSRYGSLIETSIGNLQSLEFNIYFSIAGSLQEQLRPMIIPTILELQDLPSSGFRMIVTPPDQTHRIPAFSMKKFLGVFDNIVQTMKISHLEDSVVHQIIAHLLRCVGVMAFNDLLERKDFLSRERGRQIDYNVTRLEEWCQIHGMADQIISFKELRQAINLSQLKAIPRAGWKFIRYICCMLSYKQIHHLLSSHVLEENQLVIDDSNMSIIIDKINDNESLFLSSSILKEVTYELPDPRVISTLRADLPDWLLTPRLKRLAEIISGQTREEQEQSTNQTNVK